VLKMGILPSSISVSSFKNRQFRPCLRLGHTHSLTFNLTIKLDIGLISRCILLFISDNLILCSNHSNLDRISVSLDSHCLFHIVMGLLLTPEALHPVVCHRILLITQFWYGLNESNHSFITLTIEFFVVTCF
jgi:hypothetical protein